jgi:hypothetical protein
MIRIYRQEIETQNGFEDIINERVANCTCKTNINPQLMFRQSYTGMTDKCLVGNWTMHGFWISKFRRQLAQFRPDIIARFSFKSEHPGLKIRIRYSIGFSSIFFAVFVIFFFSCGFIKFGYETFMVIVILLLGFYGVLIKTEFDSLKESIDDNILKGIAEK